MEMYFDLQPNGYDGLMNHRKNFELFPYQEEVYNKVACEDSILFLPTGAGKTVIAAVVAWDKYVKFPDKKIVFIVNRIPLIAQQAKVFEDIIKNITVEMVSGPKKTVKSWVEFRERPSPIIVIMDSLFRAWVHEDPEIITHATSLLIFDEVHNALGGFQRELIELIHQLKPRPLGISNIHNNINEEERQPQILGLTASPVLSFTSHRSLHLLLQITRCKIVDVQKEEEDLQRNVPVPLTIVVEYSSSPSEDAFQLFLKKILLMIYKDSRVSGHPHLKKLCQCLIGTPDFDNKCEQLRLHALEKTNKVDFFAVAVLTFLSLLSESFALMGVDSMKSVYDTIMSDSLFISLENSSEAAQFLLPFMEIITKMFLKLKQKKPFVHEFKFNGYEGKKIIENPLYCISSRLQYLLYILDCIGKAIENTDGSFCGIIFCDTRASAHRIVKQIEMIPKLNELYRPKALIGKGKTVLKNMELRMTDAEQRRTLEEFRKGDIKLLVATSVVEEGLDVSVCNIVIRYDSCVTLRSFVQSRGRARNKNSLFIIMEHILQPIKVSKVAAKAVEIQKALVRKIGKEWEETKLPSRHSWESYPRQWLDRFEDHYMVQILRKETETRSGYQRIGWLCELTVTVENKWGNLEQSNDSKTFYVKGTGSPSNARREAETELCRQLDAAGYFASLGPHCKLSYRLPLRFLSNGLCICQNSSLSLHDVQKRFAPNAREVKYYNENQWSSISPVGVLLSETCRRRLFKPKIEKIKKNDIVFIRIQVWNRNEKGTMETFEQERIDGENVLEQMALEALQFVGVICLEGVSSTVKDLMRGAEKRPRTFLM